MDLEAVLASGTESLWVVGIGASAGGVEALRQLLPTLPDGAVAYVIAQHMSPVHPSLLVQVLSRETKLQVTEIVDGLPLAAGHIYVAPPAFDVLLVDGALATRPAPQRISPQPSIDVLFGALAGTIGPAAVGVVLSGTGSDGVAGMSAIAAAGGRTVAQDPATALYRDMPLAVVDAGAAEFVLPAREIGALIADLVGGERSPRSNTRWGEQPTMAALARETRRITDWDIANYKDGTLSRQLERRVHALGLGSLSDYLVHVLDHPEELATLRDSMLITVTRFMRDSRSFEALREALMPVVAGKKPGEAVRAWVAGCATGEEAYSVAMMLAELVRERGDDVPVKVFATDISDAAMEVARRGVYLSDSLTGVPAAWRERYFDLAGEVATVTKRLREILVIARQDVTRDPPLVRMDLVSCRNLLIYLVPDIQRRVQGSFWSALNPGGVLFLGRSESIVVDDVTFDAVSAADKVYRRGPGVGPARSMSPVATFVHRTSRAPAPRQVHVSRDKLRDDVRDQLLADFCPPSLLVDSSGAPVHQIGDASRYLRMPSVDGEYTVVGMAIPGLRTELDTMLNRVRRDGASHLSHSVVLHGGDGTFESLRLVVSRLHPRTDGEAYTLVSFVPAEPSAAVGERSAPAVRDDLGRDALVAEVADLEAALAGTREHLQAVVEELEASNEELQAMNEELQASSEELQATNEELETTNEELQATNEELTTVNEALEVRTSELTEANVMLQGIQDAVHTAVVLLDREGRVQRFSALAVKIFGLTAADLGRRLVEVPSHVDADELSASIARVLAGGTGEVSEVSAGNADYLMQVMPLRVADRVDGLVVALANITALVQARLELSGRAAEFQTLAEAVPHVVYRSSGDPPAFTYVSAGSDRIFGVPAEAAMRDGVLLDMVHPDDRARLLGDGAPSGPSTTDFRIRHADGSLRFLRDTSQRWLDKQGRPQRAGTVIDVTDLRTAVTQAERERLRAESVFRVGGVALATTTAEGTILSANDEFVRLTGRDRDDLLGKVVWDLAGQRERERLRSAFAELEPETPYEGPATLNDAEGGRHEVVVHLSLLELPTVDGGPDAADRLVVVAFDDNTDVERARREAEARGRQVETVFGGTAAPMAIADELGQMVHVNAAMARFLETEPAELVGRSFADITFPEDVSADRALFGELVRGDRDEYALEKRFTRGTGEVVWGRLMVTSVPDAETPSGRLFIKTVLDITGEREREASIRRVAHSDVLTGLANRVVIFDRLQQAILRARREGEHVSVIFIDLDGFKGINDRFGHDVGDDVLREAAERLRAITRESDSVARLGGDEFLLVASHRIDAPHDGARLADRVLRDLGRAHVLPRADAMNGDAPASDSEADPDQPAGQVLKVTPSVGVAQYPADGDDVEELVRKADVAMYAAKGRGGNQVRYYSGELAERSRTRAALRLELGDAIERGQVIPCLQPVVDAETRAVVAFETLARWAHPDRGVLPPSDFLADAEEFDLLDALALQLVRAVQERYDDIAARFPGVEVAFNLAPGQLRRPDFMADLGEMLTCAAQCTVEVTEAAAFSRDEQIVAALAGLRARGVRTSLDDFGTGYSSMLHLKTFGFDEVKIGREFVSGSPDGPDTELVRAMVGMAHAMGAVTVAEGVETEGQVEALRHLGVDRLQGFLFARPMPLEGLLDWASTRP